LILENELDFYANKPGALDRKEGEKVKHTQRK
jgi:hypothetical protein